MLEFYKLCSWHIICQHDEIISAMNESMGVSFDALVKNEWELVVMLF